MQFRRLKDDEKALALEIAHSLVGNTDESNESFGLESVNSLVDCDGWGLFVKGEMSGAAWQGNADGPVATVLALALPRTWWRMGLPEWMLGEIAQSARAAGATTMRLAIRNGTLHLGEVLDEAGFVPQTASSENFPAGVWSRPIVVVRG
jgi:hypothetical protein